MIEAQVFIIILIINKVHSQDTTMGSFNLIGSGLTFAINHSSQLLERRNLSRQQNLADCALLCISRVPLCRTIQFDSDISECTLIQGDLTTGQIVQYTSQYSRQTIVATLDLTIDLFMNYGQACQICTNDRHLVCISNVCQCSPYFYYDGLMCVLKKFENSLCSTDEQCRTDLKIFCISGRCSLSIRTTLAGTTVAGYGNGILGNDSRGLANPCDVQVSPSNDLYIVDRSNHRILMIDSGSNNSIIVAGNGTSDSTSSSLNQPRGFFIDFVARQMYIADNMNARVLQWRLRYPQGSLFPNNGMIAPRLSFPTAIRKNPLTNLLYVSDQQAGCIVAWSNDSTSGQIVAGNCTLGSGPYMFGVVWGFDIDNTSQNLYVVDSTNCRIQKWPIYSSSRTLRGYTVAGGNGCGSASNQLNSPHSVYVSKLTGDLYVSDTGNNRIQKWSVNGNEGITIAGSENRTAGASAYLLNQPTGITMDNSETYLFVADRANHRVQRFRLV